MEKNVAVVYGWYLLALVAVLYGGTAARLFWLAQRLGRSPILFPRRGHSLQAWLGRGCAALITGIPALAAIYVFAPEWYRHLGPLELNGIDLRPALGLGSAHGVDLRPAPGLGSAGRKSAAWFAPWQPAGAALATVGVVVCLVSQAYLGDSLRAGMHTRDRTRLVTSGLYRHVRHPMYSGMMTSLVGLFLLVPSVTSAVMLVAGVAGYSFQAGVEEAHLLARHGEAYRQYLARTGRFLPRWPGEGGMGEERGER